MAKYSFTDEELVDALEIVRVRRLLEKIDAKLDRRDREKSPLQKVKDDVKHWRQIFDKYHRKQLRRPLTTNERQNMYLAESELNKALEKLRNEHLKGFDPPKTGGPHKF